MFSDIKLSKSTKRTIHRTFAKLEKWVKTPIVHPYDTIFGTSKKICNMSCKSAEYINGDGSYIEKKRAHNCATELLTEYKQTKTQRRFDITDIIKYFFAEAMSKYGHYKEYEGNSYSSFVKYMHYLFTMIIVPFINSLEIKTKSKIRVYRMNTKFEWTRNPDCYHFCAEVKKFESSEFYNVFCDIPINKIHAWYDADNKDDLHYVFYFITVKS